MTMFIEAIVIACVVGNSELPCIEYKDMRGPYMHKSDCISRVLQMSRDVYKHMDGYRPVSYTCNKLPEGRLSSQ